METIKTVFVTGATGNQGGAVANNLVMNGFVVKALTRDAHSPKVKKLEHPNLEYVTGDLNNVESYSKYLHKTDAVFSVQTFEKGSAVEVKQGMDLAGIAKSSGVRTFVYSSGLGADLHTGIPHWESKLLIENYIRQIDLPYSILRPASLFENFLIPQVKNRLLKGKLVSPIRPDKIQQFIASDDIGKMAVRIFKDPSKYYKSTVILVSQRMDNLQVAKIFSEVLGKEIHYQQLPSIITRLAMGKSLYKMFMWLNKNDLSGNIDPDSIRNEFPQMMTLKQWIGQNFTTSKP
ncbi:MAG: NmrA/HSCARG family protein [Ginsengibacter sp.]